MMNSLRKCSVVLSATLLSSVAAAAPASVNGCTQHNWASPPKFSYSYDYVAVKDYQCTICGERIDLMQTAHVYVRKCLNCGAREELSPIDSGGLHTDHPCYN